MSSQARTKLLGDTKQQIIRYVFGSTCASTISTRNTCLRSLEHLPEFELIREFCQIQLSRH